MLKATITLAGAFHPDSIPILEKYAEAEGFNLHRTQKLGDSGPSIVLVANGGVEVLLRDRLIRQIKVLQAADLTVERYQILHVLRDSKYMHDPLGMLGSPV